MIIVKPISWPIYDYNCFWPCHSTYAIGYVCHDYLHGLYDYNHGMTNDNNKSKLPIQLWNRLCHK